MVAGYVTERDPNSLFLNVDGDPNPAMPGEFDRPVGADGRDLKWSSRLVRQSAGVDERAEGQGG